MIDWVIEKTNLKLVELRFCLEHTGIYSQPLCELLEQMDLTYYLISGLELKRSMGIKRGKNDKVDAKRIAQYAFLRRDDLIMALSETKCVCHDPILEKDMEV